MYNYVYVYENESGRKKVHLRLADGLLQTSMRANANTRLFADDVISIDRLKDR